MRFLDDGHGLCLVGRRDRLSGGISQLNIQGAEIVAWDVNGCHDIDALILPSAFLPRRVLRFSSSCRISGLRVKLPPVYTIAEDGPDLTPRFGQYITEMMVATSQYLL